MKAGGERSSPEVGEVLLPTWEENTAGGHGLAVAMGDTLGTELLLTKSKHGNSQGGRWWVARPWVYWLKQMYKRSCKTITLQSTSGPPSWHKLSDWLKYTHKNSLQIWMLLTSTRVGFEERSLGRRPKALRSGETPQGCQGS